MFRTRSVHAIAAAACGLVGAPIAGARSGGPTAGMVTAGAQPTQLLRQRLRHIPLPTQRGALVFLLQTGRYTFGFAPPVAGTLTMRWYIAMAAAPRARAHPVQMLVASGTTRFATAGSRNAGVTLTPAGRRRLEHSSSVTITAVATFRAAGAAPISVTRRFGMAR